MGAVPVGPFVLHIMLCMLSYASYGYANSIKLRTSSEKNITRAEEVGEDHT
jgi:hypothetical protein